MNEHGFIKAVHRKLPPEIYRWKIHDTYTGGVPDTWYAGPAGTIFVEYKYISKLPKRPTTKIMGGLSALQLAWLDRMWSYKLLVAVIIGSTKGAVIQIDQNWHKPLTVGDFESGLDVSEVATWLTNRVLKSRDQDDDNRQKFSST